jgi:anti-sigma factor (TIGR02949 family)
MNCTEANDLLGEAIDGSIPASTRSSLFEHLGICRGCRKEFELETITKAVVKSRCIRVGTPPEISHAIISALNSTSQSVSPFFEWIQDVFTMRRLLPALVASVAIVVVLVFFNSPTGEGESDAHTASNDVIFQSLQNFSKLQNGELKPALIAKKAEDIHQYLDNSGMDFAKVQPMDCCRTYGAFTSEYKGIKLAQVVYTMSDDVMYVYQVRKKNVFDGSALIIPPAAKTALEKTGWYTDPHHPNCNVVLWIVDQTLCAAVSSMKKDEMLALLNRN